jgi:hypothetical protein
MSQSRNLVVRSLVIAALLAICDGALASERIVSKYSSTARKHSLSFKDHSDVPEGGFEALFPGFGGYRLLHLSGDERSWINLKFGQQTVDLYSATMHAGGGTFPHKANDVVEWRGSEKNSRFTPYERSTVIGHTEGANEDAEARQMGTERERSD